MHQDKMDLACRRVLPIGWQHGAVVDTTMVRRHAAALIANGTGDAELAETTQALHNPPFDALNLFGLSENATPAEVFAAHHLLRKWVDAKYERSQREVNELRCNTRAKARLADAQAWLAAYNGLFCAIENAYAQLRQNIGSLAPV